MFSVSMPRDFLTFHSSMQQNTFQIGFYLHFSPQSRENAFTQWFERNSCV